MNRKFKILGLILVVLGSTSLSASATAAEFHSEAAHTILSGGQPAESNDVITFRAGTVTCNSRTYAGTAASATSSELTVTPAISECNAFGFVNAKVDVPGGNVPAGAGGGCDYRFTPSTASSQLHVVCGAGEFITTTAFNCYVKWGSQTLTGVSYANSGSGSSRDVTTSINITGLTYTQESKSFPGCTNGTFSDGKWSGAVTAFGSNTSGAPVGIWYE